MKIKSVLANFFRDMRQNPDTYTALILGGIGSIAGLLSTIDFDVDPKLVSTITLTVLTTIAFIMLNERHSKTRDSRQIAIRERTNEEISNLIKAASTELCIFVRIGGNTLRRFQDEIEQAIKRNCSIRIMMCADSKSLVTQLAYRGATLKEEQEIRNLFRSSKDLLLNLQKLSNANSKSGNLEVRQLRYIPPYTIFIADGQTSQGSLFALIETFRVTTYAAPSLKVHINDDLQLFKHLYADFNRYWDVAVEARLDQK